MAQVIRSPKTYDVIVVGSGAGGGMAAKILTEGGLNVALLEAGPQVHPEKDFKMFMWPYDLPHRGVGVGGASGGRLWRISRAEWLVGHSGEPYTSAPGSDFQLVSFAHRRRAHQSLGTHRAAVCSDRFPFLHARWARLGLADLVRRHRAVLRQSRGLHRRVRHERKCLERARRRFPAAAEAALHRTHRQESLRQAQHHLHSGAARDSHEIGERAACLATIAASAGADARPRRTSAPARC